MIGSIELSGQGGHSKIQLGFIFTSCHTDSDPEVDIDLVPIFTDGVEMLVPKTHPGKECQKV